MIKAINSMPTGWSIFAYIVLGIGAVSVAGFLVRYMANLPWRSTEEGRHLVAMSASVGAFFAVYLVQAFIPDWPGRAYVMVALLVALVANCVWRWVMLERHLARRRRATREGTKP